MPKRALSIVYVPSGVSVDAGESEAAGSPLAAGAFGVCVGSGEGLGAALADATGSEACAVVSASDGPKQKTATPTMAAPATSTAASIIQKVLSVFPFTALSRRGHNVLYIIPYFIKYIDTELTQLYVSAQISA
jgi:hypothetical protein